MGRGRSNLQAPSGALPGAATDEASGGQARAERTGDAKGVQGAGEGHVAEPQAGRAPEGGRRARPDGCPAFPPGLQTLGLRGQAAKDRARAIRWERGRGRQISGRFLRKTGTDAY